MLARWFNTGRVAPILIVIKASTSIEAGIDLQLSWRVEGDDESEDYSQDAETDGPSTASVKGCRSAFNTNWNVAFDEPKDWAGDERNIVLTLARIWYTGTTGQIASKDAAATWLLDHMQGPHRTLLSKARAAYLGEKKDDLASYPAEVAAFVMHARQSIERLCSELPVQLS